MTTPNQTLSRYLGADRRNRLVNPAFQHSQEHGDAALTTSSQFPADQWQLIYNAGAITFQRVASQGPNGSRNRLRATVTTAKATLVSGDFALIRQTIEGTVIQDFGWGTSQGRAIVARIGIRAPAGTYSFVVRNVASTRAYTVPLTITAGQANTDVVFTVAIPAETTGVWETGNVASLFFDLMLALHSVSFGTANTWQTANLPGSPGQGNFVSAVNNVFELFEPGLYVDPFGTGIAPRWELPDFGEELRRCQRYWCKSWNSSRVGPDTADGVFHVISTSGNRPMNTVRFPVEMRIGPSISLFSTSGVAGVVRNADTSTDVTAIVDSPGFNGFGLYVVQNQSGQAVRGHYSASARM